MRAHIFKFLNRLMYAHRELTGQYRLVLCWIYLALGIHRNMGVNPFPYLKIRIINHSFSNDLKIDNSIT